MKVLLATPAHDGRVTDTYLRSVLNLTADAYDKGIQVSVLTLSGESLITRARNNVLHTFLSGDWTDLLFVDGDIGFQPENAWRLLDSPYSVAAMSYPLKKLDWELMTLAKTSEEAKALSVVSVVNYIKDAQVTPDGFAPVLDAGTGFMRITRNAVERLIAQYPQTKYFSEDDGLARWALFDTGIENGRYLSEDYFFCRLWQALGEQVMVDTIGPALQHRGLYEYGV